MKTDDCAPEGLDWGRLMFDIANRAPVEPQRPPIMQMVEQRKIRALLAAYDKAMLDPSARIPTLLHAAIEGLK